jgi:hypothetical protein
MLEQLMTRNTPFFCALASIMLGLLVWRFKPVRFRLLSRQAVGIGSGLFWSILAGTLVWFAWDYYYRYYAPSWYRFIIPLGALVFYFVLGLLIRGAALRLPGNPTLTFCLLGGLESIPEHTVAIYRFHILEIPLLQGTGAAAIFIFAFFEYTLFWSLALCLAITVDRLLSNFQKRLARAQ